MNKAVLWIVILVIVLVGIYWAMSGSTTPAPAQTSTTTTQTTTVTPPATTTATVDNAIVAGDQVAGKQVIVSSVTLNQDASVVVHKDAKGAPGAVIGTVTLKAGSYTNVKVALTEAIKAGDTVYPMLHPDTNSDGTYNANEEGAPLKDAAGNVLVVAVKVK